MRKYWGASAVVVAVTLAGCSSGSAPAAVTKTVTKTKTVTVTVTAAAPETTETTDDASGTGSSSLAVGKTANLQGNKITVLVVGDKRADGHDLIGADQRFVGVKVKYCLAEAAQLGYDAWRVVGSDGGEYEAVDVIPAPTDWPQPTYPYDDPDSPMRAAGSCVTGWMMFGVNKAVKPAHVAYRGAPGTAEWKVS